MATFALVHGAYHRGAHFDLLAAALRTGGHRVVAPDLPATDRHAGAAACARVVADATREAIGDADDVVVVGHSMGGLTAPVVATLRPVRGIVYLAALIPEPGRSFDDVSWHESQIPAPYEAQTHPLAAEDGSARVTAARAAEVFFHDCPWERQRWATSLMRPQHWRVLHEPCPLEAMPDVPSSFIACRADRVVNPAWIARIARDRFDSEPVEIEGGHSPAIARPDDLAAILGDLAE